MRNQFSVMLPIMLACMSDFPTLNFKHDHERNDHERNALYLNVVTKHLVDIVLPNIVKLTEKGKRNENRIFRQRSTTA